MGNSGAGTDYCRVTNTGYNTTIMEFHNIGEVFEYKGERIVAQESADAVKCDGCAFFIDNGTIDESECTAGGVFKMRCFKYYRIDRKSVIFKRV